MRVIKDIFSAIRRTQRGLEEKGVYLYSARTAYYILFSFPAFLMLVLMSAKLIFPNKITEFSEELSLRFPDFFENLPEDFIPRLLGSDVPIFSLTVITLIWSASKWAKSLSGGLCSIYGTGAHSNIFVRYLLAVLYTVSTVIIFALCLGAVVYSSFKPYGIMQFFKAPLLGAVLTVFILMIYKVMAARKERLLRLFPGAALSSLSVTVYTSIFSLYVKNYSNYSLLYGSIGLILAFMLWLYNCVLILFLGAALNVYLMKKRHCIR